MFSRPRRGRQPQTVRNTPKRRSARVACAGEVARGATTAGHEARRHRMIGSAIPSLALITLAAVVAPLLAEASRRFLPVPEVVIQILLGIALGPFVLNLVHPNTIISAMSDFGLTFLMFLAGTELDLSVMRQGHLGRAAGSWGASLVVALGRGRRVARDWVGTRPRRGGSLPDHHRPRHAPADPSRFGRAAHQGRTFDLVGGRHRRVRADRRRGGAAHQSRRPDHVRAARALRGCRGRSGPAGHGGPSAAVRRARCAGICIPRPSSQCVSASCW